MPDFVMVMDMVYGVAVKGASIRAMHGAPALLVWLAVAAIAVSAAWWTWRLMPMWHASVAPSPRLAAVSAPARDWLAAGSARESSRYVLRWSYAGRPGVCILGLPGLVDRTFRVGDEIEPGYVLREVGDGHVLIEASGRTERIERMSEAEPSAASAAR